MGEGPSVRFHRGPEPSSLVQVVGRRHRVERPAAIGREERCGPGDGRELIVVDDDDSAGSHEPSEIEQVDEVPSLDRHENIGA